MSEPKTTTIDINGHACRVWTKGSGPKIGWLAGFGGLPRWIPFPRPWINRTSRSPASEAAWTYSSTTDGMSRGANVWRSRTSSIGIR